jgi:hypothetical protein
MTTTIEIEIEESLLEEADETIAQLGVSRTAFITATIKHALRVHYVKEVTAEDEANAFLLWLVDDDDVDAWQGVQDWGDPWDGPDDSRLN